MKLTIPEQFWREIPEDFGVEKFLQKWKLKNKIRKNEREKVRLQRLLNKL